VILHYKDTSFAGRSMRWVFYGLCTGIFAFLLLPLVAIIPLSFNAGSFLSYPLAGLSWRWYASLLGPGDWVTAFENSLIVATGASALATPLGMLAALGLTRLPSVIRPLLVAVLLAPMFVPVVVVAVSVYLAYAPLGLADSYSGLIVTHATLASPFVVVLIGSGLQTIEPSVLRAASSLGASPPRVLLRVLLPLIAPSVLAAALMAFATSFDEIVVALFLAGTEHKTLPMKMFEGARDEISPLITAAATLLIFTSVILLSLAEAARRWRERLQAAQ